MHLSSTPHLKQEGSLFAAMAMDVMCPRIAVCKGPNSDTYRPQSGGSEIAENQHMINAAVHEEGQKGQAYQQNVYPKKFW